MDTTWAFLPIQTTFHVLEDLEHSRSANSELYKDVVLFVAHECLALVAAAYHSLQMMVRILPAIVKELFSGTDIAYMIPESCNRSMLEWQARCAARAVTAMIFPSSVAVEGHQRRMSHSQLFLRRVSALAPGLIYASPQDQFRPQPTVVRHTKPNDFYTPPVRKQKPVKPVAPKSDWSHQFRLPAPVFEPVQPLQLPAAPEPIISAPVAPAISAPVIMPIPVLNDAQNVFYGELCEEIGLTSLSTLEALVEPVVDALGYTDEKKELEVYFKELEAHFKDNKNEYKNFLRIDLPHPSLVPNHWVTEVLEKLTLIIGTELVEGVEPAQVRKKVLAEMRPPVSAKTNQAIEKDKGFVVVKAFPGFDAGKTYNESEIPETHRTDEFVVKNMIVTSVLEQLETLRNQEGVVLEAV